MSCSSIHAPRFCCCRYCSEARAGTLGLRSQNPQLVTEPGILDPGHWTRGLSSLRLAEGAPCWRKRKRRDQGKMSILSDMAQLLSTIALSVGRIERCPAMRGALLLHWRALASHETSSNGKASLRPACTPIAFPAVARLVSAVSTICERFRWGLLIFGIEMRCL